MTDRQQKKDRRALEALLIRQAVETLEPQEAEELERLLAAHPEIDAEAFERLAATVLLANIDVTEPLPAALGERVAASASRVLEERRRG